MCLPFPSCTWVTRDLFSFDAFDGGRGGGQLHLGKILFLGGGGGDHPVDHLDSGNKHMASGVEMYKREINIEKEKFC